MRLIAGSDWSIAFNSSSANALSDAKLLERIGRELRHVYEDTVEEPVPNHLAAILDRLNEHDPTRDP